MLWSRSRRAGSTCSTVNRKARAIRRSTLKNWQKTLKPTASGARKRAWRIAKQATNERPKPMYVILSLLGLLVGLIGLEPVERKARRAKQAAHGTAMREQQAE